MAFQQNLAIWNALTQMHRELHMAKSKNHRSLLIDYCDACVPALRALCGLGWIVPGFEAWLPPEMLARDTNRVIYSSTGVITDRG